MKITSFYHKATGAIRDLHLTTSDNALVALNTPADHIAIDGHHDHLSKRVDLATGEIVDYQPQQPSPDHAWSDRRKRWELTQAAIDKAAAKSAALARIEALTASQHAVVRWHLLGDVSALAKLRLIQDEIATLQASL